MAIKVSESDVPAIQGALVLDWSDFADGEWWRLEEGVDYEAGSNAARPARARIVSAHSWAKARGYRVEYRNSSGIGGHFYVRLTKN